MEKLTDSTFADLGFDISKEPFERKINSHSGSVEVVYKNYIRDGSGRHDGYIFVRPISKVVHTIEDLYN